MYLQAVCLQYVNTHTLYIFSLCIDRYSWKAGAAKGVVALGLYIIRTINY